MTILIILVLFVLPVVLIGYLERKDSTRYRASKQELEDFVTRKQWLTVWAIIAFASIAIRILIRYDFDQSALLYVGIPFSISLLIAAFRPPRSTEKWWHVYRDQTLLALMIFLGSSVILFEGFVCVLFFLPIYLIAVTVGFIVAALLNWNKQRKGSSLVSILPLLVMISALEGTSESMSLNRVSQVTVTKIVNLSPEAILENIAKPINLQQDRGWLISIFPMPYRVDFGALTHGEEQRIYTRYSRWFVTNTHEGEMHLKISDASPTHVVTEVIHDSTFFASYVNTQRIQFTLKEIAAHQTEITLRIDYERTLDPAWYFHPLQQFSMGQMAEFLADEVMIRE